MIHYFPFELLYLNSNYNISHSAKVVHRITGEPLLWHYVLHWISC